jgi:choline monooxygenase
VTATLPASWYHDPAVYACERQAIFGREWLLVGHAGELARPGAYLATTIAGWNIVVVRDATGVLRGFHNVCRHRAGPLVDNGIGQVTTLVCRYHGWAYDLDGRLRTARDFGESSDFDPEVCSLAPVTAAHWRNLVFVNLAADARPLLEALGGLADACEPFPMEDMVHTLDVDHDLEANWKTYADNYLEGYHIPLVHRELNRQVDASRYSVTVGDRWCRHDAPARKRAATNGRWLWRWPNLALNLYPDAMNIERFLPVGPRRTRISYRYFFRDGVIDEEVLRVSKTLIEEDRSICEAVQRNLESGAYTAGVLSPRHEEGVGAFQSWVREALRR